MPAAVGDFLILGAIRASGRAVAGKEAAIGPWMVGRPATGISICQTAVCFDVLERLVGEGWVKPDDGSWCSTPGRPRSTSRHTGCCRGSTRTGIWRRSLRAAEAVSPSRFRGNQSTVNGATGVNLGEPRRPCGFYCPQFSHYSDGRCSPSPFAASLLYAPGYCTGGRKE